MHPWVVSVGWRGGLFLGRKPSCNQAPPREQPTGRSAEEPGTVGLGKAQCWGQLTEDSVDTVHFRARAERESRCLIESGVTNLM